MTATPTTAHGGAVRALRGGVAAVTGLTVSAAAHSAANGPQGVGTVLTLVGIAALVGVATAGRQFTYGRAFWVLAAVQPLLHVALTSSAHQHHASVVPVGGSSHRMLLAHLGATLIGAAALSAVDRRIWSWLRDAVLLPRPKWFHVAVLTPPLIQATRPSRKSRLCIRIAPWRGPPAGSVPHPA